MDADALSGVADEIRASGTGVAVHTGSVASWETGAALVALADETFGALNGLVNNAGVLYSHAAWDEPEWAARRMVEVNIFGTIACGTYAMRWMIEHSGGAIVKVTSGAALGLETVATYSATKGAIASLTYTWALEEARHGIRVNAISPVAMTAMPARNNAGPELTKARLNYASPDQVAPLVGFLLSDEAKGLTGEVIHNDGRLVSRLMKQSYARDEALPVTTPAGAMLDALTAGGIGKEPVIVTDTPGFASSRLGVLLGLEAIRMLEQEVASAEDIDQALTLGYGHPMGPLRLTDLVGLDVRLAVPTTSPACTVTASRHHRSSGPWWPKASWAKSRVRGLFVG